ncbi:hypothetical protein D9758_001538 [Tetrapyrgos nigripes]|uniref:Uncharacterized protein n=1 Tax=Tetrapyrgos nigripes TaxID=182062 RepID=A0A8H5GXJ0_9AGAR|nr:hypothetical protein D9758_001538 [Tetrapyrgos nigripes]
MQQPRSEPDPANTQYAMNATDWDVLFDSERFEEIDDEGNIVPKGEPIEYELEMENPLHDAHASQSGGGTLMDELIETFSSPQFAIQESTFSDPSPPSSTKALARLYRSAGFLPGVATFPLTHLLSSSAPEADRHINMNPHPHPRPHSRLDPHQEVLHRYQQFFIHALSQAASAKARHHRKPKENGYGHTGRRRSAKPAGPRSSRVKGSRKSMPMSAAVKTRLKMDMEDVYHGYHGTLSRKVFGAGAGAGAGSSPPGSGSSQRIGINGTGTETETKWDEEMETEGTANGSTSMSTRQGTSEMESEDSRFVMQVEALSDRFSGAFISEC